MADGDPMVLATRYGGDVTADSNWSSLLKNGNFEYFSSDTEIADGWTWTTGPAHYAWGSSTKKATGYRTGGTGSYYLYLNLTGNGSPTPGVLGWLQQSVNLPGNANLAGNGHDNQTFHFKIWIKEDSGGISVTFTIQLRFFDKNGAVVQTVTGVPAVQPDNTWRLYELDATLTADTAVSMDVYMAFSVSADGTVALRFDDACLYTSYTFGKNPTIPDRQDIFYPRRQLTRNVNGGLRCFRPGSTQAKHRKVLRFGAVNLAQFKALRSLYLLDAGMTLYASHPHLPAAMPCRWINDFDFALVRHIAPDLYQGNVTLEEI